MGQTKEAKQPMINPVTLAYWWKSWVEISLGSSFKWCFTAMLLALELQVQQVVSPSPGTFWAAIHWLIGPNDRGILQLIAFFYVSNLFLGTTASLLKDSQGKREFEWGKIAAGLAKGAVYFLLMGAAWKMQTEAGQAVLPVIAELSGKGLEAFVVLTEFVRFLKNSDKLLERLGVGNILGLRELRYYIEANVRKRLKEFEIAKHLHVLYVEDNRMDRRLVRTLIEDRVNPQELVVDLEEAVTLAHAIESIEDAKPFDVVLVDLDLPDAKGLSAWTTIHTKFPKLPIVVVTGVPGVDLHPLLEQGVLMVCKKGITSARLIEMLVLAESRQRVRETAILVDPKNPAESQEVSMLTDSEET